MGPFTSDIQLGEALQRLAASYDEPRCWLLIDPLLRAPAEDAEWQDLAGELEARTTLIRLAHRNVDPKAWPKLVELDLARARDADISRVAAGMAIRDWTPESLRMGLGRRIGGWMFGAGDAAALAHHLAKIMLQSRPDGSRALLRLQDPAVLDLVWSAAGPRQRQALLGPLDRWAAVDRWTRLTSYGHEAQVASEAGDNGPLQFDPDQWNRIETSAAINRAWRSVATQAESISAETLAQTAACVRRGAARGLADPRDWEAMAIRALTIHPAFDQHPRLAALLDAREPDVGFARLVMGLTDADWTAIAGECRQPRSPHQQVGEEE